MITRFKDRVQAGRILASKVLSESPPDPSTDVLVLALPRGGIPVAGEIATALCAPLDVLVVRKIGVPGQEELAMGAVASGGLLVLNEEIIRAFDISETEINRSVRYATEQVRRHEAVYRDRLKPLDVFGKTIYVVDDGAATGSTMLAALRTLRPSRPTKLIVAIPVAPTSTLTTLQREADAVICLETPEPFLGVGQWYQDFSQTSDEQVRNILGVHYGIDGTKEPLRGSDPRPPAPGSQPTKQFGH